MFRVIADSEDEAGDEELALHNGDQLFKAANIEDVVNRDVVVRDEATDIEAPQNDVQGTSSSEKLRREIQTLHSAVVQPTPKRAHSNVELSDGHQRGTQNSGRVKRIKTSDSSSGTLRNDGEASERPSGKQFNRESSRAKDDESYSTALDEFEHLNNNTSMTRSRNRDRMETPVVVVPIKFDEGMTTRIPSERKKKSERKNNERDELDHDELAVGLPKDQYKPRPTRSRSSRASLDAPDELSNSPIPTENPKRKRNRTADDSILSDHGRLREMGFRSSQAEQALVEAAGDFKKAVSLILDGNDADAGWNKRNKGSTDMDQSTEDSPTTRRRRGYAVAHANEDVNERSDHSNEGKEEQDYIVIDVGAKAPTSEKEKLAANMDKCGINTVENNESDKDDKQSTIAKSNLHQDVTQRQMNIDDHTTHENNDDEPVEPDEYVMESQDKPIDEVGIKEVKGARQERRTRDEREAIDVEADRATTAKKKGRGRPKKAQGKEAEYVADQSAKPDADVGALQTIEANITCVTSAESEQMGTPPLEENSEMVSAKTQTPESKTQGKTTTQSHSPLSKARVPIKVGLSRKARIEPLLRVIKK